MLEEYYDDFEYADALIDYEYDPDTEVNPFLHINLTEIRRKALGWGRRQESEASASRGFPSEANQTEIRRNTDLATKIERKRATTELATKIETIHAAVENQIKARDPIEVYQFYNSMRRKKVPHHDTIHLIGYILVPLIFKVWKYREEFDSELYKSLLKKYKNKKPEKIYSSLDNDLE